MITKLGFKNATSFFCWPSDDVFDEVLCSFIFNSFSDKSELDTAISTLSKDLPVDEESPELMAEDQTLSIQDACSVTRLCIIFGNFLTALGNFSIASCMACLR